MLRTLIYYKPEQIDLAKKLRDNCNVHKKETDIICVEKQDDIEYAREEKYDEAIFIEDIDTVVIHDIKSGYTNRCSVSDVCYPRG